MAEQSKEEKKQEEPESVPFLVYVKGFVLVGAILFGMFFLSRAAENQPKQATSATESATLHSLSQLKNSFSKEKIQEQINHEMRTNESYKETVEILESKRNEVMGEATKAADQAVESGKNAFFDYMYENTVGALMERFIEQMPEDQKEKLIEKVQE